MPFGAALDLNFFVGGWPDSSRLCSDNCLAKSLEELYPATDRGVIGMDERARDPRMGVAEERCDGVAATFLPCAFRIELEVVLLSSRLRKWVLFMFAKPAGCRELRRDDNRYVLVC